jgi:hypothetical protein
MPLTARTPDVFTQLVHVTPSAGAVTTVFYSIAMAQHAAMHLRCDPPQQRVKVFSCFSEPQLDTFKDSVELAPRLEGSDRSCVRQLLRNRLMCQAEG